MSDLHNNAEKVILCYGDSNTWGYVPNEGCINLKRFPHSIRWTGLLQSKLGSDYYIIEEGLNGRTTNINHFISPDRNGKNYLLPCLYSHAPIDLVILALGGNDLKSYYQRTAEDVAQGISELMDIITQSTTYGESLKEAPKILLLSLLTPLKEAEDFRDEENVLIFPEIIKKSQIVTKYLYDIAEQKKCYFLDVADDVLVSDIDGLHLDENGHQCMAEKIYRKVKDIFQ